MKNEFVYPYGADRHPHYREFSIKKISLLEEYHRNVKDRPSFQMIYQLRYNEAMRALFKAYAPVWVYMDVQQYMKEWNLKIGRNYGVIEEDGSILISLKLISAEGNTLYFEDGIQHSTSMAFSWVEVPETKTTEEPPQPALMTSYEDYPEWSQTLALSYTVKELEKQLAKCERLTSTYAMSHLRVIQKSTSMQSNAWSRAQAGNLVRDNYERKRALQYALEIHQRFPEKAKQN